MNNIDILIEYISPSEKKQNYHVFKIKCAWKCNFRQIARHVATIRET